MNTDKILLKNKSQPSCLGAVISRLLNTDTGESKQYVGFTYTKINGIYGYLGIDYNKEVIFIYADERGIVMDVMDNYKAVDETINLNGL